MNIARIINGTVTNVEVASQEWVDAQDDPGVTFVAYTDDNPACIGLPYDAKADTFAQPEPLPDPVAVAYERGKVDGASELLSMQAVAEAL